MSKTIGYVCKDSLGYIAPDWCRTDDLQAAKITSGDGIITRYIPVVVTEEPGLPTREVVELRGTVDLDKLKFAIRGGSEFFVATGMPYWRRENDASLFRNWRDAYHAIWSHDLFPAEIVGIREVPGPTVRTVTEITPEMLK